MWIATRRLIGVEVVVTREIKEQAGIGRLRKTDGRAAEY